MDLVGADFLTSALTTHNCDVTPIASQSTPLRHCPSGCTHMSRCTRKHTSLPSLRGKTLHEGTLEFPCSC